MKIIRNSFYLLLGPDGLKEFVSFKDLLKVVFPMPGRPIGIRKNLFILSRSWV